MTTHPLLSLGGKLLKLRGYNRKENPTRDYNESKKPPERKPWTYQSQPEADLWMKEDGHVGWVVAEGYIVLDIDDSKKGELVFAGLVRMGIGCIVIKTPNGYQFIFKDTARVRKQMAKALTPAGIVVDYRLANKGYIVLPSDNTEGRDIIDTPTNIDPMPAAFLPIKRYDSTKDEDKLIPAPVYEGCGRDDTLFTHLCRIRQMNAYCNVGLTREEIAETAFLINACFMRPPIIDEHVRQKIRNAEKYEVEKPTVTLSLDASTGIVDSDLANARRIIRLFGRDMVYTVERGWFVWDGQRWVADAALAMQKAKLAAESIFDEIKISPDQKAMFKWARLSQSAERLKAVLFLAQSEPGVARKYEDFDADPWLLNCINGSLDLHTGELREHRQEDLCSRIIPVEYNADASCELWLNFLHRIMGEDEVLISYLKRLIGYSLTGLTTEQILIFLLGFGANGKTVLLETIKELMGDYGLNSPTDAITQKQRGGGIPNDIARLAATRYVAVNETAEGQRLNEPLIKDLTGGDTISARFLHREFFDFRPKFKLWIRGNHKPQIKGTDDGIWRRIHLIPFDVQIPKNEQDRTLTEKLKRELSGILTWAMQGCLAWQEEGLRPPDKVLHAVKDYRQEMDILGSFLDERCIVGNEYQVKAKDIYTAYSDWAVENGERAVSQRKFGTAMTERGFDRVRTSSAHFYMGIGLCVTDVTDCDPNPQYSPHIAHNKSKSVNKGHKGSQGSQTVNALEVIR